MAKRTIIGIVTNDKTAKTRRVEMVRLVKYPKYGKIVHRKTVCYAHDELNQSHKGDRVEIVESRPRSKTKRWELVKVIEHGREANLAEMRAQQGAAGSE